ncbi:hypothetical protein [Shimia sp. SK013]|uniref:hypothetical protein n=1 Tax=Shimia sp. SK013 TaxID=1389006 RepID=UPI001F4CB23B|nr:hypothetical protein [Shimia sp. SK013]
MQLHLLRDFVGNVHSYEDLSGVYGLMFFHQNRFNVAAKRVLNVEIWLRPIEVTCGVD